MDQVGRLSLGGRRYQAYSKTIRLVGVDLTGASFRMEVRMLPNTPGAPLLALGTVGTAAAEGIRLVSVEQVDGQPVSTLGLRVNKSSMEALPFSGELGDDSAFAYDLMVDPSGGLEQVWLAGPFVAQAGVTGATNAPMAFASGASSARVGVDGGTSSFQIGETIVNVTIAGGQGPRGNASGPLGADSVGAEEIVSDPGDLAAIRDKIGITGQVVSLATDLMVADFAPRPGDAFILNGRTLTIQRMADTPYSGIFMGAGTVVIRSGLARPKWWTVQPLRSAARAVSLGGGGIVALDAATYAPEFTVDAPLTSPNVTFDGAGKPQYGAGFAALSGGTICQAPFVVNAPNVAVQDLGVDAGLTVCNTLYGGTAQEGLIAPNIGQVANASPRAGIRFSRVAVLCKDATAPVHCILVENAIGALVEDFDTVKGTNGIVLKTRRSTARNGYCRGHSTNFAIDKSDSYSPSYDNKWENIDADSLTGIDTGPFRIQAASSSGGGHTLSRIRAKNTTVGVSLEPSGANVLTDITLDAVTTEATQFGGIIGGGAVTRLAINNARIANVLENAGGTAGLGSGIDLGAGMDSVTISGTQIVNTKSDGVRNQATNVLVIGTSSVNPGAGFFGFKGAAGSMKVPANSNIGTTSGSVAV